MLQKCKNLKFPDSDVYFYRCKINLLKSVQRCIRAITDRKKYISAKKAQKFSRKKKGEKVEKLLERYRNFEMNLRNFL